MRSTLILITSLYARSVFQYEPVIQPGSHQYLHHMTLYECRGNQTQLEATAQTNGDVCNAPDKPAFQCNTIAATWSLGSEVCRELHSQEFSTAEALGREYRVFAYCRFSERERERESRETRVLLTPINYRRNLSRNSNICPLSPISFLITDFNIVN